jgi:DNA-binding MarR family transcriptional regulator
VDFEQAKTLNDAIRTVAIRHRALAGSLLAQLGLYPGQEVLLLELGERGAHSQAQLAVACGCEPPTITHTVRKLEAAGLVMRRASPTDARVILVELSDRGKQLLPQIRSLWVRLAEMTVSPVSSSDLPDVSRVLTELAAGLSGAVRNG